MYGSNYFVSVGYTSYICTDLMDERNKVFNFFYQLGNDGFMILSILENATIIATKHFQNEAAFFQK